jgi:sugar O-acyltransferase (sialic acid O-acetyltransferase NeuD family)
MRVVIYGSRPDGHASVVLEMLASAAGMEVVGLLDDWPENAGRKIGALEVIGGSADLPRLATEGVEGVLLGFGAAQGREAIAGAVAAAGLALPTLVHASAQIAASASLADGAQVLARAYVGPKARVGRGGLINTGAIVEHDVSVGDYSVIDPGAVLTGRVRIGESVEIGSGAVLIPDVEVGPGATVGAGAVVTRPVAAGETVVGVPARPLARP